MGKHRPRRRHRRPAAPDGTEPILPHGPEELARLRERRESARADLRALRRDADRLRDERLAWLDAWDRRGPLGRLAWLLFGRA